MATSFPFTCENILIEKWDDEFYCKEFCNAFLSNFNDLWKKFPDPSHLTSFLTTAFESACTSQSSENMVSSLVQNCGRVVDGVATAGTTLAITSLMKIGTLSLKCALDKWLKMRKECKQLNAQQQFTTTQVDENGEVSLGDFEKIMTTTLIHSAVEIFYSHLLQFKSVSRKINSETTSRLQAVQILGKSAAHACFCKLRDDGPTAHLHKAVTFNRKKSSRLKNWYQSLESSVEGYCRDKLYWMGDVEGGEGHSHVSESSVSVVQIFRNSIPAFYTKIAGTESEMSLDNPLCVEYDGSDKDVKWLRRPFDFEWKIYEKYVEEIRTSKSSPRGENVTEKYHSFPNVQNVKDPTQFIWVDRSNLVQKYLKVFSPTSKAGPGEENSADVNLTADMFAGLEEGLENIGEELNKNFTQLQKTLESIQKQGCDSSSALMAAVVNVGQEVKEVTHAIHQLNLQSSETSENSSKLPSSRHPYKPLKEFVGRRKILQQIQGLLEDDDESPVVITGIGGIGKSELCREVAEYLKPIYDSNIAWFPSSTFEELRAAILDVAEELLVSRRITAKTESEITVEDAQRMMQDIYSHLCSPSGDSVCQKVLFIFDDAELLTSGVEVLHFLPQRKLQMSPSILITSRSCPVTGWVCPERIIHLGGLSEEEIYEFFKKVFKFPTLQSADVMVQVHQFNLTYSGHPLYILLATSWIHGNGFSRNVLKGLEAFLKMSAENPRILERIQPSYGNYMYMPVQIFTQTMKKIKAKSKGSLKILQKLIYLDTIEITVRQCSQFFPNNQKRKEDEDEGEEEEVPVDVRRALEILREFSFIDVMHQEDLTMDSKVRVRRHVKRFALQSSGRKNKTVGLMNLSRFLGKIRFGASSRLGRLGEKEMLESSLGSAESSGLIFETLESFELRLENVLGSGQMGNVVLGWYKGEQVAVKIVRSGADTLKEKLILQEISIMRSMGGHPNIAEFKGAMRTGTDDHWDIYLVLELSSRGNLFQYMRNYCEEHWETEDSMENSPANLLEFIEEFSPNPVLRTRNQRHWCSQVADACSFLESKKIVHGDLAARNVLLFDNDVVKIVDFGMAHQLPDTGEETYIHSDEMPLPWRTLPPETLQRLEFSCKTDVWAFGIFMWEIYTLGGIPYPGRPWFVDGFLDDILAGLRPPKPTLATDDVYKLMLRCWSKHPKDRPTFAELSEIWRGLT